MDYTAGNIFSGSRDVGKTSATARCTNIKDEGQPTLFLLRVLIYFYFYDPAGVLGLEARGASCRRRSILFVSSGPPFSTSQRFSVLINIGENNSSTPYQIPNHRGTTESQKIFILKILFQLCLGFFFIFGFFVHVTGLFFLCFFRF